jgi:hypothetical protein
MHASPTPPTCRVPKKIAREVADHDYRVDDEGIDITQICEIPSNDRHYRTLDHREWKQRDIRVCREKRKHMTERENGNTSTLRQTSLQLRHSSLYVANMKGT